MNTQVKSLENSQVELTVEVGAEVVAKAVNAAYNKMKNQFNIPGFRKGKVPKAMIEKTYGAGVFYPEAADIIIRETLKDAVDSNNIEIAALIREEDLKVTEMSNEGMKYVANVTIKPEVEIGEYKDLAVEVESPVVTDEEVDAAVAAEAEKNAREIAVTDRAVEPQDKTLIDFEGFVDGVAFEGGKGTDYSLVIGSKSFIEGFEDQLIGKNVGEEVEVNVTFPAEYQAAELAGKPATFKVTVKEIKVKELPEINDDFAADVSEFETLAEYKASIKEKLTTQKEEASKSNAEDAAIEKAVENAKVVVPEAMIEEQVDRNVKEFGMRMKQQGLELEQYLGFVGQDMETFRGNFAKDAEYQLRSRLVLEKIVEVENFEVSEEELNTEIANLAAQYKMEADKLAESMGEYERKMFTSDLRVQKAARLVADTAKVSYK
ncbi:MAG: trigger factor [Cellulosilyticaceae bacterium]